MCSSKLTVVIADRFELCKNILNRGAFTVKDWIHFLNSSDKQNSTIFINK